MIPSRFKAVENIRTYVTCHTPLTIGIVFCTKNNVLRLHFIILVFGAVVHFFKGYVRIFINARFQTAASSNHMRPDFVCGVLGSR